MDFVDNFVDTFVTIILPKWAIYCLSRQYKDIEKALKILMFSKIKAFRESRGDRIRICAKSLIDRINTESQEINYFVDTFVDTFVILSDSLFAMSLCRSWSVFRRECL